MEVGSLRVELDERVYAEGAGKLGSCGEYVRRRVPLLDGSNAISSMGGTLVILSRELWLACDEHCDPDDTVSKPISEHSEYQLRSLPHQTTIRAVKGLACMTTLMPPLILTMVLTPSMCALLVATLPLPCCGRKAMVVSPRLDTSGCDFKERATYFYSGKSDDGIYCFVLCSQ